MKKLHPAFKAILSIAIVLIALVGYKVAAIYYAGHISRNIDMSATRSDIEEHIGLMRSREISVEELGFIYVGKLEPGSFVLVEYYIPGAYFVVVYDLQGYPIYKIGLGI